MAEEIASSRPAAVDSAAAMPPAAQGDDPAGDPAISGLASTTISWSMVVSSLPLQPKDSALAEKAAF